MPRRKSSAPRLAGARVDRKTIVAVLVCIALSAGVFMFFTGPMRQKADDLTQQVAQAQLTLDRNLQRSVDISTGKKSGAAELFTKAQELDGRLPSSVDKIALVASMSSLAASKGITLGQMDPVANDTVGRGKVKSQSFTVSANGNADALADFLEAVQRSQATVAVSAVNVNFANDQNATATFTLRAFYVPTAAVTSAG